MIVLSITSLILPTLRDLRDAFFQLQPHGPLALREGGVIARLAREVIPNSDALTGPSPLAMDGHCGRFVSDGKIYVDNQFSDAELGLICGTYKSMRFPMHQMMEV